MAIFLKGNKRQLFVTLGLSYGNIVVEGFQPIIVTRRDHGRKVLEECIAKKVITADEAAMIEASMQEAGVPENMTAIMGLVKDFEMPAGFVPSNRFQVCTECAVNQLPPHGHIVGRDGGDEYDMSDTLRTFEDSLRLCDNLVTTGQAHVLDGVTVLKQVVEADVPVNTTEMKRRYDALPEDVRAKVMAEATARFRTINVPGLGDALVISFSLESLFGEDVPGRDN